MHYNVRVARRATTTTTSTVSTGPRPPALSVGVFGLLTFEGDGAALVGSSDGYVTRVSLSTLNNVNEMLRDRHKVRFELSVENRHKIVMLGENKKFALEKHHQGDRRFKMALIDNDDYAKEGYVDLFDLKINTRKTKCGLHPFIISANFTGTDGLPYEVIVKNKGKNSRFEGEVISQPGDTHSFYIFGVATRNDEFTDGHRFFFENQGEHGWLGSDAGNGGYAWAGVAPLKDMGRRDVCMRTFWQTKGAAKGYWMLQAYESGSMLQEGWGYIPVRHHAYHLMINGGWTSSWKLEWCNGDNYCRVRKNHDSTGWCAMYRISPFGGGVAAIATECTGKNQIDLWKPIKVNGLAKDVLRIVQHI